MTLAGLLAAWRGLPHRQFLRLALPLVASNVTVALLGIVDTAVVGHLPEPGHLGGVAIGGTLFSFLYWGLGFLRMGTSGITAQHYGAGDHDGLRSVLTQTLALALLLALVLLVFRQPLLEFGLSFYASSAGVKAHASGYFLARLWGAPAALGSFVLLGWFLGVHNARAQLWVLLLVNLLNIVLDFYFVWGLGMGAAGVGWASALATSGGALLALWLLRGQLKALPGRWLWRRISHARELRSLLGINQDIFLRTLALVLAFTFFNVQSAALGDLILGANAVLMNFLLFTAFALDGIAFAAEAMVGRAIGQGSRPAFLRAVQVTGAWSVIAGLAFVACYALAGPAIVALMTSLPGVRATALQFLPWAILLPVTTTGAFFLDGVFTGATRARAMRNTMFVAVLMCYLPVWWATRSWGNHGLWLAMHAYMLARTLGMAAVYLWIERHQGFVAAREEGGLA